MRHAVTWRCTGMVLAPRHVIARSCSLSKNRPGAAIQALHLQSCASCVNPVTDEHEMLRCGARRGELNGSCQRSGYGLRLCTILEDIDPILRERIKNQEFFQYLESWGPTPKALTGAC